MPELEIETPQRTDSSKVYDLSFWSTYLANTLLMVAISILFRYADFVTLLGGTERHLGLIVGVGMVGALVMRCVLGISIDRFGTRLVWLLSLVLFIASVWGHLLLNHVDGIAVYVLRMAFATSVAGVFGSSITYTSLRAPNGRVAEMIGTLGSSGFVAMAIGPAIADWLMDVDIILRQDVDRMFWVAGFIALMSLVAAIVATWRPILVKSSGTIPLLSVVWQYHPGPLIVVGIAMGVGIGMPHSFLRTFTAELNIESMRTYFIVYSAVAFAVRMATRHMADRFGTRPLVLAGLGSLTISMLLYNLVQHEWQLAIPAVVAGIAHALLFPAVVAGASAAFPDQYRGLGTTLILAIFDVGNLVGSPLIGGLVDGYRVVQLPAYPLMFATLAIGLAAVSIYYAWVTVPRKLKSPPNKTSSRSELEVTAVTIQDRKFASTVHGVDTAEASDFC